MSPKNNPATGWIDSGKHGYTWLAESGRYAFTPENASTLFFGTYAEARAQFDSDK